KQPAGLGRGATPDLEPPAAAVPRGTAPTDRVLGASVFHSFGGGRFGIRRDDLFPGGRALRGKRNAFDTRDHNGEQRDLGFAAIERGFFGELPELFEVLPLTVNQRGFAREFFKRGALLRTLWRKIFEEMRD